MKNNQNTERIYSIDVSIVTMEELTDALVTKNSTTVAICNVNSIVNCDKDPNLQKMIGDFTYKVPDGMPLVWYLRRKKIKQKRLTGSNVMHEVIKKGLDRELKHFYLGSTEDVLASLKENLTKQYPKINIVGTHSPPFGNEEEILSDIYANIDRINEADILWVGLGMPKQEKIIYYLREYNFNQVGIGAVFQWEAGENKQAPEFIQNIGIEWVYRIIQEPRRLWKRYFFDFLYLFRFLFRKTQK